MEAKEITNANLLDIIFDGRNKEYGAYELRKGYNKRLIESMIGVVIIVLLVLAAYFLPSHKNSGVNTPYLVVKDVQLEEINAEKKPELPPPPPPPKIEPPKIEMAKFTPPVIVKDNEVKDEDRPPEQEKLQDTRIGTINQEGVKDEGTISASASDGGKGIIEAPKAKETEDYDKTFLKVEIESEYPGGASAWQRYLYKNFRYPEDASNNEIQGVVIVQFIVDKEGIVSDVEAVSGPDQGGLREEAIRVIRKSGTWIPAIQNGRKVKSYKKQPIVFKLMTQ
ncbi:MAG: TonB family protein [Bacteroidetes bacterium]|nr:TonB family protein [Bacteroidota bacterium]